LSGDDRLERRHDDFRPGVENGDRDQTLSFIRASNIHFCWRKHGDRARSPLDWSPNSGTTRPRFANSASVSDAAKALRVKVLA
jgi:hypothetical protein